MRIAVVGASGGVGTEVLKQALAAGHEVTAVVRHPERLQLQSDALRIRKCDIQLQPWSLKDCVAGHDAVISTLGASRSGPVTLYSHAAGVIARAMRECYIRRLVFLSNFGILDERAPSLSGKLLLWLARHTIRETLNDHRRALAIIKAQVPEFVVVRPVRLTNGPFTGRTAVSLEDVPRRTAVSRADVAAFMLAQVSSDQYLCQWPAIAAS